jgi:superfamily II DNA or RNA helicase
LRKKVSFSSEKKALLLSVVISGARGLARQNYCLAGHFARVVTYKTSACAQTLIDDFSGKTAAAHIAISVGMLDTGIDVPEVLNLTTPDSSHPAGRYYLYPRSKRPSPCWQCPAA